MNPIQLALETDYVRPEPVARLASLHEMLRVATDILPDCGDRPEALLGPWPEELDRAQAAHRTALMIAIANWCFCGDVVHERALHIWSGGIHAPHTEARRPFRAVRRAPYAPWYVVEQVDDGWVLDCPIALAPQWIPTKPVQVPHVGSVTQTAIGAGTTLCARVAPAGHGWVAALALALPGRVPTDVLRDWLVPAAAEQKADVTYPTVENLLRDHGQALVRHVHKWAWQCQNDAREN